VNFRAGIFDLMKNKTRMKRIIIINGLIAGAIVSLMFTISYPLTHNGTLSNESSMVVGYISMVIALSLVFVGIKSYRDQHQKGVITFGRGVVMGILITLIASVMYAGTWEIYYNTIASDFMEKYTASYLDKMKKEGASNAEIAQQRAEMESFSEQYKNPIIRFGVTLMEILPVGIIITLISAALLRRKEFLPSTSVDV
jgi:hypothetical protein